MTDSIDPEEESKVIYSGDEDYTEKPFIQVMQDLLDAYKSVVHDRYDGTEMLDRYEQEFECFQKYITDYQNERE